jgi:hypothetical protein
LHCISRSSVGITATCVTAWYFYPTVKIEKIQVVKTTSLCVRRFAVGLSPPVDYAADYSKNNKSNGGEKQYKKRYLYRMKGFLIDSPK